MFYGTIKWILFHLLEVRFIRVVNGMHTREKIHQKLRWHRSEGWILLGDLMAVSCFCISYEQRDRLPLFWTIFSFFPFLDCLFKDVWISLEDRCSDFLWNNHCQLEAVLPLRDVWQFLGTFLIVKTEGVLLASGAKWPRMLLNIL